MEGEIGKVKAALLVSTSPCQARFRIERILRKQWFANSRFSRFSISLNRINGSPQGQEETIRIILALVPSIRFDLSQEGYDPSIFKNRRCEATKHFYKRSRIG